MRFLTPTRNPRHRLAVLLLTTALVASPAAFAQNSATGSTPAAAPVGVAAGGQQGHGMMQRPMQTMDANKDGSISKAEYLLPTQARFDAMDTNKDGAISKAEFQAPVEKSFDLMDANKDGKISSEEQKTMMKGQPMGFPMKSPGIPPVAPSSAGKP